MEPKGAAVAPVGTKGSLSSRISSDSEWALGPWYWAWGGSQGRGSPEVLFIIRAAQVWAAAWCQRRSVASAPQRSIWCRRGVSVAALCKRRSSVESGPQRGVSDAAEFRGAAAGLGMSPGLPHGVSAAA